MANNRFDAFTKFFAARHSRRTALQATGLGLAAGLARSRATAQDAAPEATPAGEGINKTTFLFVQTAAAGTFTANSDAGTREADGTPTPGGGGDYLLTLEGHHGGTVYFSDRPERVFGVAQTQLFLDGLGFSPSNPPNAALVTQTDDGTEDVVVLELLAPTYDEEAGTLTYGATILAEYQGDGLTHVAAEQQDGALPETFGRPSLFIDDCAPFTECGSRLLVPAKLVWKSIGPVPGGPYPTCWNFGDWVCHPCEARGNTNVADPEFSPDEYLSKLCNNTYPECKGLCHAA